MLLRGTFTIARRELTAFFVTPVGWIVIALFLCLTGFLFAQGILNLGRPASLRPFFEETLIMLFFIAPAISMRLLAEEHRLGTLESLMTCPVSDGQVVLGKWVGALAFFVIMLVPTAIYPIVLEIYANPDIGPILTGYLGLIMVGGLYLAFGALASALWSSQVLAYLLALFFWIGFWAITQFVPAYVPAPWSELVAWLSVHGRFASDFGKGVIDLSTVIYLAALTIFFLVTAVKVLESRRWR
ncbi:MAG: ABC transporter permease subunit [Planctomycetota bacterium]